MAMLVTRATYAVTAVWLGPVTGTASMATATVPKPKTAAKATKAQKDAALRLKQAQRAAILLKQVSDPTRLQVILMLSEGEKHVGALCEALSQSQPAVSHHLALLRHGGIIAPRRQGKNNFYSLTDDRRTARQDRQGDHRLSPLVTSDTSHPVSSKGAAGCSRSTGWRSYNATTNCSVFPVRPFLILLGFRRLV